MIGSFTFENLPCRVVFGSGTLSAAAAEIQDKMNALAITPWTSTRKSSGLADNALSS